MVATTSPLAMRWPACTAIVPMLPPTSVGSTTERGRCTTPVSGSVVMKSPTFTVSTLASTVGPRGLTAP